MNAQLKSPLDGIVSEIVGQSRYLSPANARQLLEAVKASHPNILETREDELNLPPQKMLENMIRSMGRTIEKMNMAAVTSDGGINTTDLKKLVDSQEKQIKLLAKLSETLTANERQQSLEDALTESLDEVDDKVFKDKLLVNFRAKLAEKTRAFS